MGHCTRCGYELVPGAKFCFECGAPVASASTGERKMEYVGRVYKCPACGEELPAFTAICPVCGYELRAVRIESSVAGFIQSINHCDELIARQPKTAKEKKGWAAWGKGLRTLWVFLNLLTLCIPLVVYLVLPLIKPLFLHGTPILSAEEKKKAALIENYVFPNEREAILEALLFTRTKMAFLASEKYTVNTAYWMRLWDTKATQLQKKAELLLKDDTTALVTYTEIQQSKNKVKKRVRTRAIIGAILIVLYISAALLFGGWLRGLLSGLSNPFGGLSNPFSGWSNPFSGISNPFSRREDDQEENSFVWVESELSKRIPVIEAPKGHYSTNTDMELDLRVEDLSYDRFERYIVECKEAGFTEDAVKETSHYRAYDSEGYYLALQYWGYSSNDGPLDIKMMAPAFGDENFVWPESEMGGIVPKLNASSGQIVKNTDEKFEIDLYGIEHSAFLEYTALCENLGFTNRRQCTDYQPKVYFSAFNEQGYYLQASLDEVKHANIELTPPCEMTTIRWPSRGNGALIPKPESNLGYIESDSESWFGVYVGDTTLEEFNDYIDACLDAGFDIDVSRSEDSLYADNSDGVDLSVFYEGNNTMHISVTNYGI